jgi:GT2 family glycosyltransferase
MKIGIIIVTYNSQKEIKRILESIIIQKYENLVVYIVDNNSSDDTLNIIQKYKSRISFCVISSRTNNGYAKGNNTGIQKAMAEGCELVFILNPDMQLEEKCIKILTERIMSDEKIGAIGPIVLDGNKSDDFIQSYGFYANFRTQKKEIIFPGKKLTNEIPPEIYVDYVLGGAMMIRSRVLKIVGVFEEDYFMYNDELDISYRIKKAGFKTLCIRDAIVRHFHDFGKNNPKGNNLMYYYIMRNKYLYFKKHHLYNNIFLSLLNELMNVPFKIIWVIRRMKNIKLLKFYYLGLLDGLLGKKGIANKSFHENKK